MRPLDSVSSNCRQSIRSQRIVRRSRCLAETADFSIGERIRPSSLDRVFRALADGTHRTMIHALARGQACSAGELGRRFRSAQPTISRHLKVLERAGLVQRSVEGRVHQFRLRQRKLEEARGWIARQLVIRHEKLTRAGAAARHDQGWRGALDQLARMMEGEGLPDRAKG